MEASGSSEIGQVQQNILAIPSVHVRAPILWPTSSAEDVMLDALEQGVVHDPRSGFPSTQSIAPVVIFGHSSDMIFSKGNYKSIFANTSLLKEGEIITISDEHNMYTYQVRGGRVISATDGSIFEPSKNPELRLVTCWPIGTSWKRFVVDAVLLATAPLVQ